MSIFKRAIDGGKIKAKLKATPISEEKLLELQFDKVGENFVLCDLTIYNIGAEFHYYNPAKKLIRIKNILQVADLIYGNTKYLK